MPSSRSSRYKSAIELCDAIALHEAALFLYWFIETSTASEQRSDRGPSNYAGAPICVWSTLERDCGSSVELEALQTLTREYDYGHTRGRKVCP